jgi:hypothetical protein
MSGSRFRILLPLAETMSAWCSEKRIRSVKKFDGKRSLNGRKG